MPRPPSNKKLYELSGRDVDERMVADPETAMVLFLDDQGRLRVYDRGELKAPDLVVREPGMDTLEVAEPGRVRSFSDESMARAKALMEELPGLVKQHGRCVERRSFWKGKRSAQFHDLARHGALVLWRFGYDNGQNLRTRVVECADEHRAKWFLHNFAAPKRFVATDGYYVPGLGAINRNYGKGQKRVLRGVAGDAWYDFSGRENKRFDSAQEAQLAFDKWEHRHLVGEWRLFNMELDKRAPDPHAEPA
jgi:hypothetical protein